MVISESSGNEPWIFRVDDPDELIGSHREQMRSALAGEATRYLLYSPAWQGRGRHFGIEGRPASHALAVTDRRFVITRDPHDGSGASTTSIAFEDILTVEKGGALLLAWLVLRYQRGGRLETMAVLHKATGGHHFDEAIRLWRATCPSLARSPSHTADEHWKSVPRFLYYEIEPILLADERLHASLHAAERWVRKGRFFAPRPRFVQPWASAVFADRGVIAGVAEQPPRPGMFTFGANVTVIPYDAIAAATVVETSVHGTVTRAVRIDVSRSGATTSVLLHFDGSRDDGETVATVLGKRDGADSRTSR